MPWDPIQLNDGNVMPGIAYGTWRTGNDQQSVDAVNQAFTVGIKHIDTAQNYANETEAGVAIRECGLPRESIFVTTKWSGLAGLGVAASFRNSLKNLGLTYVDLYLIHSPDLCDKDGFQTCWKEMEKLKDAGLAKSIGVSNFGVEHLEQVLSVAKHIPAVNQTRINPYIYVKKLPIFESCKQKGIFVEAYGALDSIKKRAGGPVDKPVADIAQRLGVSIDQVLLAWVKAKDSFPVTMSINRNRLEGYINAGTLDLTPQDIKSIDEAGIEGAAQYLNGF